MKILIADKLAQNAQKSLKEMGHIIHTDASLSGERLMETLKDFQAEIIVVRSTKIHKEHIDASKKLNLIIRAGAGTNTIDVDYASKKGIYVANCPGKNAIAVAELTFGHLLNIDRAIYDNALDLRSGIWNKKKYSKAKGVFGKTLALIGFGSCGKEVCLRAKAFGMNVKVWSRSFSPQQAEDFGVTFADSPLEAAKGADVLSVHLALTQSTRGIISKEVLEVLNDDAYVINTSRGGIVDESALLEQINIKNLKAGLDVFEGEPGSSTGEFHSETTQHKNIYGTHHIGASTQQASDAVAQEVVHIISSLLSSGKVPNCINLAQESTATTLLSIRHADKVGVLARVLGILRESNHNVQEMENILFKGGFAACAKIHFVGNPSDRLITTLNEDPDIFSISINNI